jgi:RNA polymerase sigma-70 factor (ECF subfamily)
VSQSKDTTFLLVRRAKEGDAEAMNALFARHRDLVRRAAARAMGPALRGREEPEDLAQTAFRDAILEFDQFEGTKEGSFRLWLRRIVENKARDRARYWRAGKRGAALAPGGRAEGQPGETTEPGTPALDPSVTELLAVAERKPLVRGAVESLPERWRRAIEYAYYDGLSFREAAKRLGLPSEDAARMLLRRAERALKAKLPPGVDPTG